MTQAPPENLPPVVLRLDQNASVPPVAMHRAEPTPPPSAASAPAAAPLKLPPVVEPAPDPSLHSGQTLRPPTSDRLPAAPPHAIGGNSGSMSLLDFVAKRAAREGYIDTKRDGNQTYYRWRPYVTDPTTGGKKRGGPATYLGNDKTRRYRER